MVEMFQEDFPHEFITRTSLAVPFQLFDELVHSDMKSLDQSLLNKMNEVLLSSVERKMQHFNHE